MAYYPATPGPDAERIGQLVMSNDSRDVYQITALPDGGPSHQHYAITGVTGVTINRKLRISVKSMWRDFSPVREG